MCIKIIECKKYDKKIVCTESDCNKYRHIVIFDNSLSGLNELYNFLKRCYKKSEDRVSLHIFETPLEQMVIDALLPEKGLLLDD